MRTANHVRTSITNNGRLDVGHGVAQLLLPTAFVVLYGSGFVGAKFGLPYCPPLTFLALRFGIAGAIVALYAWCTRSPWPRTTREAGHIAVAGLLTVATFSAGVFESINFGISPALSALINALQPLLIAVLAKRVLRENVTRRQWVGLALGFTGVVLVLGRKVHFDGAQAIGVAMSILGLIGVTAGNLYQKRFCVGMNVVTGGAIQSGVSAASMLLLASAIETPTIRWTPAFVAALAYMVVGVSIGALSLLYVMIRRGDVSRVASMFYLVPVSAAAASFLMFGETLDLTVVTGVCIVATGVLLVNAKSIVKRSTEPTRPITFRLSGEGAKTGLKWTEHGAQGRRGALIHEIYQLGSPLRRMAIVRFTPGSSAAAHRHASYETIFIVSGSYHDDFGEHNEGELVVYPPASEHSWSSPNGATLLVVWDGPTVQLTGHNETRSMTAPVRNRVQK
jgi:drug/metabolite transporter (DMT)-like permease/quercetin dioxygenase-like cupin family protein